MKWVLGGVLAVVLLIAGATAGYAVHFQERGLPRVEVAGESVTGLTQAEVAHNVAARASDITVTVSVDGKPTTATLAEVGVSVDAEATAAKAFEANRSFASQVGALFQGHDVPVVFTVDDHAVADFAKKLSDDPMVNAEVSFSPEHGAFVATDSHIGHGVDATEVNAAVSTAAQTLTSQSAEVDTNEVLPIVTGEQAVAAAEEANALIVPAVSISDGIDDFAPTLADKAAWVEIPLNADQTLGSPAIDDAKVKAWVEQLGKSTNEAPVPGIHNVNTRGDVVAVADPGKLGWTVNNTAIVARGLLEALHSGHNYVGDFDYDRTEPTFETRLIADGAADLIYQAAPGEKWIDLDLSANTVTAYEGATIMQGPIYIVPGEPDTPTVTGIFRVYLQYAEQTMRGLNKDGTKYETPDVPWVTYFYGGYAFHGAPWRSSFGWSGPGGSHGCVNMPVSGAKWIYDWAEIGTTVVSHY